MADQSTPEKQLAAAADQQVDLERSDADDVVHYNDVSLYDKGLNQQAKQATATEHSFGFITAMKTYKRAAFWSVAMSTSIVMEGYDTTLIGSFYGYPSFRDKYGAYLDAASGYQISADWQTKFNCLGALANIIGAMLNGYFTAKYGHRVVLMVSLFLITAFIFITFFAPNIEVMLAGAFLCNIPWGVFATTGPAYAAEATPLALRGYLTAYINLCWCIGQLISAGVLKGLVNNPTQWSYKVPFAVQWVWPIPLFIAAWMAPESPWHLVRIGKLDEAKRSLQRLSEPSHNIDYDAHVAMMVHTNKLEIEERAGATYWDAFRGTNLRRTEIACMAFMSQITNGGALCYSGTFFYEQTGISASASYGIGLGGTGIAFIGVIISWFFLPHFGRRTIWLWGFGSLVIILWIIGFLAIPQGISQAEQLRIAWAQSILCIVWLGSYSMSVGPIVYTIIAEIGSTRLRTQTVVLARSFYYFGNIIFGGLIEPRLISPGAWDAKGKTAFFWAGLATLTFIWAFFRLVETKDRTFGELDVLFQKNVPSRKFASYKFTEGEVFTASPAANDVDGDGDEK